MTFLFHSVIFSIITIHMLNTGKILPENILTFTQDARKEKINCSSAISAEIALDLIRFVNNLCSTHFKP